MKDRLEIGFGMIVQINGSDKKAVVVDVGNEGGDIEAAAVHETDEGLYWTSPGGVDTKRIESIVGQLTKEEVFSAAALGIRITGGKFTDELKDILEELSRKDQRIIK